MAVGEPRPPGRSAGRRALDAGQGLAEWGHKYVLAPRYRRSEQLHLVSGDGTRLAGARLAGPPDATATVVLVHGFVNWSRTPRVYAFAHLLARHYHVVVPDLRGHGQSGGTCTLCRDEPLDVAAAVAAAPSNLPVVTIGMSLGGASVLLHAARFGGVAGTVAISAPAWWGRYERSGSARVQRLIASPIRRTMLSVFTRTRIPANCEGVPDASALVAAIAPAFVVVAHDPEDTYFGPDHAERIYEWAQEPKELWWYANAGHGTDLLTPELAHRLVETINTRLGA